MPRLAPESQISSSRRFAAVLALASVAIFSNAVVQGVKAYTEHLLIDARTESLDMLNANRLYMDPVVFEANQDHLERTIAADQKDFTTAVGMASGQLAGSVAGATMAAVTLRAARREEEAAMVAHPPAIQA